MPMGYKYNAAVMMEDGNHLVSGFNDKVSRFRL